MEPSIILVDFADKPDYGREIFDHTFHWYGRKEQSTVRINIYTHNGYTLVIFQDLGKGTSVTNASEQLATEIGKLKNLDPEKTIWLECYPYYGGDYDIDRIFYSYDPFIKKYSDPTWGPVKNDNIVQFLRNNLTL